MKSVMFGSLCGRRMVQSGSEGEEMTSVFLSLDTKLLG